MKTLKQMALIATFFALYLTATAQKAEETKDKWNGDKVPALEIKVDGDPQTAIKTLKDILKDEDLKVEKSGKKLSCNAVSFKKISPHFINIHAMAKKEDDNSTIVTVFMSTGTEKNTFISSESDKDAMKNMKEFLEKRYAKEQNEIAKQIKIEEQKEKVKAAAKEQKKLEKKIKKQNKELERAQQELKQKNEHNMQQKQDLEIMQKQK